MDDDQIIDAILQGNRSAFDQLVKKYQKEIYWFIARRISIDADIQDIHQDVFIKVFSNLAKFKRQSSFRTWLYTVTMNTIKNHYRTKDNSRQDKMVAIEDQEIASEQNQETEIVSHRDIEDVQKIAKSLPEKQRDTFFLRIYQNLSFEEIASVMDCALSTAKANYSHALKNINKQLTDGPP